MCDTAALIETTHPPRPPRNAPGPGPHAFFLAWRPGPGIRLSCPLLKSSPAIIPTGSRITPAISLPASCGIAVRNYCTMPLKDDHQPPADDRAGQSVGYLSAADLQTARSLTARMAAGEASRDAVLGILTIVATGTPPCRSGAVHSRSGDGKRGALGRTPHLVYQVP